MVRADLRQQPEHGGTVKLARQDIDSLALHLDECARSVQDTEKVTLRHPEMDWEDAYAVQDAMRARQLARGARLIGYKAGLTSFAKMRQMGVDTPVFGYLTDAFAVPDGGECEAAGLIHPKVEPEIAFLMKADLRGPGCHLGSVLAATEFVLPGIEVIDSRYRNFQFDLKSVIADNTSAARFVVGGRPLAVAGQELRTLGMVVEKNGQPVAFGAAAAVLGHPATAVAMLANHLASRGEYIQAGSLVLSGGVTEAFAVAAGDCVTLHVHGMGSTGIRFLYARTAGGRMPIAQIHILEGRDEEKKERLIAEVTQAIQRALDVPIETIRVILSEMPKAHYGIAGESVRRRGQKTGKQTPPG
jgi:2-oxo-3-hexenedioate decarboxylase